GDNVAHGSPGLLVDAFCERSAVGVGVDGNDAVFTDIRQRHSDQRRDGGLPDAALTGQDGNETGSALELLVEPGVDGLAGSSGWGVAEVDQVKRDRVDERVPAAFRLRALAL